MKVYEIIFEVDDYQSLLAIDDSVHDIDLLTFDGTHKGKDWGECLEAQLYNSKQIEPDIFCLDSGNMVITGRSLEIFENDFSDGYELLPVQWEMRNGVAINPIGLVDCIDHKLTKWCIGDDGEKIYIERFAFIKSKLPNSLIFKFEEEFPRLFVIDNDELDSSFKNRVENHCLKGISFRLIWEEK